MQNLMNVYLKIFVLMIVCVQWFNCENVKYKCPERDIDEFDKVSARIVSTAKYQRRFPENRTEMVSYCNGLKGDFKIMGDFVSRCLIGEVKQFGSVMVYSMKNSMKQNCNMKNTKLQEKQYPRGKCANKIGKESDACFLKYVEAVQLAKRAQPPGLRIGYVCCGYFKFLECVDPKARAKCPPSVADQYLDLSRSVFQGVLDAACGDFTENSDKCDKLAELPKRKASDRKVRTIFLPIIELWNSL